MGSLLNIRIVLVKTTHEGNVGAVARAMKAMGFQQLSLVEPACDPLDPHAIARACGAEDILQGATVYSTLSAAVSDCHLVVGTSSRARSLSWPLLTPKTLMPILQQAVTQDNQRVALVFGRERDGLSNEELQLCRYHVTVPTSQEFHSLNLAMAVQIFCYECRQVLLELDLPSGQTTAVGVASSSGDALAPNGLIEGMLQHGFEMMRAVGFLNSQHPRLLQSRLRHLFMRSDLSYNEVNILRGLWRSIQRKLSSS